MEVLPQHANFSREVCTKWIHNAELEVNRCSRGGVTTPDFKLPTSAIKSLKDNFVTVVTDKASQNFSFICKKFYCDKINLLLNSDATYSKTNFSVSEIREKLIGDGSELIGQQIDTNLDIPFIQLLPKFHKNPLDFRVIIASKNACTKPISKLVSIALKLVDNNIKRYCDAIYRNTRVQCYWIINNHKPILDCLDGFSKTRSAKSINTYDFGQMYTNLRHSDIFQQMYKVLTIAFGKNGVYLGQQPPCYLE